MDNVLKAPLLVQILLLLLLILMDQMEVIIQIKQDLAKEHIQMELIHFHLVMDLKLYGFMHVKVLLV